MVVRLRRYTKMVKSATRAWAYFLKNRAQRVERAVREERLGKCKACFYYKEGRCTDCGCYLKVKTWFPKEGCPIKQWLPVQ